MYQIHHTSHIALIILKNIGSLSVIIQYVLYVLSLNLGLVMHLTNVELL